MCNKQSMLISLVSRRNLLTKYANKHEILISSDVCLSVCLSVVKVLKISEKLKKSRKPIIMRRVSAVKEIQSCNLTETPVIVQCTIIGIGIKGLFKLTLIMGSSIYWVFDAALNLNKNNLHSFLCLARRTSAPINDRFSSLSSCLNIHRPVYRSLT